MNRPKEPRFKGGSNEITGMHPEVDPVENGPSQPKASNAERTSGNSATNEPTRTSLQETVAAVGERPFSESDLARENGGIDPVLVPRRPIVKTKPPEKRQAKPNIYVAKAKIAARIGTAEDFKVNIAAEQAKIAEAAKKFSKEQAKMRADLKQIVEKRIKKAQERFDKLQREWGERLSRVTYAADARERLEKGRKAQKEALEALKVAASAFRALPNLSLSEAAYRVTSWASDADKSDQDAAHKLLQRFDKEFGLINEHLTVAESKLTEWENEYGEEMREMETIARQDDVKISPVGPHGGLERYRKDKRGR